MDGPAVPPSRIEDFAPETAALRQAIEARPEVANEQVHLVDADGISRSRSVAEWMAEGIIDLFEVIEVKKQQSELSLIATSMSDRL